MAYLLIGDIFLMTSGGIGPPKFRWEILYSQFQSQGGTSYPQVIQKRLNGVPWMTIDIQSMEFNTGLTNADFPIVEVQ